MIHIIELLQAENNFHQAIRRSKDTVLRPLAQVAITFHCTPHYVTLTGLVVGIVGAILLPWHYWISLVLLSFSALCDGLDGTLARLLQQSSPRGVTLDYWCDVTMTVCIFVATAFWLREPLWMLGLGMLSLVFAVNRCVGAPLRLAPNRMIILLLLLLQLPRLALGWISLYALVMMIILITQTWRQQLPIQIRRR